MFGHTKQKCVLKTRSPGQVEQKWFIAVQQRAVAMTMQNWPELNLALQNCVRNVTGTDMEPFA